MARRRIIDETIRRAITLSQHSADSSELLSEILKVWGGPQSLARDIKEAYDHSQPGSMIRQRYMEMIQRLVINNTKEDISNDIDPGEMSDDELAEAARLLIRRMAEEGEEIEIDDTPEGSEEGAGGGPAETGDADGEDTFFE